MYEFWAQWGDWKPRYPIILWWRRSVSVKNRTDQNLESLWQTSNRTSLSPFCLIRMMNIGRAEIGGDVFDPTIYHANLVEAKYGFTTGFLTENSWECQKSHGVFEYDPYANKSVLILLASGESPQPLCFLHSESDARSISPFTELPSRI